jgi:putative DNA primase/helicase
MGEGGNGKSAFCQLCRNFVGEPNVLHLSLQKLENDRFAPVDALRQTRKCLPRSTLLAHRRQRCLKAITGGDRITDELKYRDAFKFRPFARLISRRIIFRLRATAHSRISIVGC